MANAVLPLFWPVSTALERGLLHFFADKSQNGSSRGGGFGEICAKMTERSGGQAGILSCSYRVFGSWSSRARLDLCGRISSIENTILRIVFQGI